jgi:hypothetical protein
MFFPNITSDGLMLTPLSPKRSADLLLDQGYTDNHLLHRTNATSGFYTRLVLMRHSRLSHRSGLLG